MLQVSYFNDVRVNLASCEVLANISTKFYSDFTCSSTNIHANGYSVC